MAAGPKKAAKSKGPLTEVKDDLVTTIAAAKAAAAKAAASKKAPAASKAANKASYKASFLPKSAGKKVIRQQVPGFEA